MEYQKLHLIDREMYNRLMDMVLSGNKDDLSLVEEIILNSNTDIISAYGFIPNICLSIIIRKPFSPLKSYYLELREHPNWKIFQRDYLK